jgi:hypothetical protein
MDIVKFLEILMIVCFGAAWPASIYKSWKSRTTKGKSIFFLTIIFTGYISGIAKTLIAEDQGLLLIPYAINTLLVGTDITIYFRNISFDRAADAACDCKAP